MATSPAAIQALVSRLCGDAGMVQFVPHCVLEVDLVQFDSACLRERSGRLASQASIVAAAVDDAETNRYVLLYILCLASCAFWCCSARFPADCRSSSLVLLGLIPG